MHMHARIYVAGHCGLVGSALVRALRARGHSSLITRSHAELDLTRQSAVDDFFKENRPDVVFLAAAKVGGIEANQTYKADFAFQNLTIATNVINSAYETGVTKLVNLGSSCIYPKFAPQPIKEKSLLTGLLEPTNEAYAVAKIAALKLCRYYHEQFGCNFISAMPTNLYGPNDNYDLRTSHVLPALIRKIHDAKVTGGAVELWGDGSPFREFLHADDLARALVFMAEHVDADCLAQQVEDIFLNVGSGEEISITDLASLVADVEGYHGKFNWDVTKPNGTPRKALDSSIIRSAGWKPQITLRDGVVDAYACYQESLASNVRARDT